MGILPIKNAATLYIVLRVSLIRDTPADALAVSFLSAADLPRCHGCWSASACGSAAPPESANPHLRPASGYLHQRFQASLCVVACAGRSSR